MTEVTKPGSCQVRIYTQSPCPRSAEVEILGVAFCGPYAREQQAYFAIGELTQEATEGLCSEPLTATLKMIRRDRAGVKEAMAAELHYGLAGARKPQRIALANS